MHLYFRTLVILSRHFLLASSEKFHNETGILPFVTLVKYRIGLLMFKITKLTLPISISRLYKLNSDVHNYNTRQAHHIHSFKGNNEFIYWTFKFQSVYIWNSIIQNININVFFPHLNIYWNVSYWITIPLLDTTNKIVWFRLWSIHYLILIIFFYSILILTKLTSP